MMGDKKTPPMPFVSSHSRETAALKSRKLCWSNSIMANSQRSHFAEHFDRAVWIRELRKQLLIVLQTTHRMRQQTRQPAGIFRLRLSEVLNTHLKVFAICIHGPHHHFITKHEVEIDLVGRYLNFAIATRNTRQNQHAILSQRLHAVENDRRETGGFEDDVEWPILRRAFENRNIVRRLIRRAEVWAIRHHLRSHRF